MAWWYRSASSVYQPGWDYQPRDWGFEISNMTGQSVYASAGILVMYGTPQPANNYGAMFWWWLRSADYNGANINARGGAWNAVMDDGNINYWYAYKGTYSWDKDTKTFIGDDLVGKKLLIAEC